MLRMALGLVGATVVLAAADYECGVVGDTAKALDSAAASVPAGVAARHRNLRCTPRAAQAAQARHEYLFEYVGGSIQKCHFVGWHQASAQTQHAFRQSMRFKKR